MLESHVSREKFKSALSDSRSKLRNYLKLREDFVAKIAGNRWGTLPYYAEGHRPHRSAINILAKARKIYTRLLVAKAPAVMIRTENPRLKPLAADAEVVINREIEQSHLEQQLRRWVEASMVGLGIMKCGLRFKEMQQNPLTGEMAPVGDIMCRNVSMDSWVHDMSARCLDPEEIKFCGHKFTVPLEEARNNPLYNKRAREQLQATEPATTTEMGTRLTSEMGAPNKVPSADQCELWEFYFPPTNSLVVADMECNPLLEDDWIGPVGGGFGPYTFLYYTEMDDNSVPKPPCADWAEFHEIVDALYDKEVDNAENAKTVLAYDEGYDEDATRITEAPNLMSVAVSSVDRLKDLRFNGVDQVQLAFLLQTMQMANTAAGNLDLLAGLSSQSETASQDMMLNENANALLEDMRDKVYAATQTLMEQWAFYFWHDPVRKDVGVRQIPDVDLFIPIEVTPEQRENNWAEMNFTVEPYSLQRKSPQRRIQEIDQVVANVLIPLLPMLMQQGQSFDVRAYLALKAKYSNLPELSDLLTSMDQQPLDQMGGGGGEGMPFTSPASPRRYIRESRSLGGTDESRMGQQIQSLLGGGGADNGQTGISL